MLPYPPIVDCQETVVVDLLRLVLVRRAPEQEVAVQTVELREVNVSDALVAADEQHILVIARQRGRREIC